MSFPDLPSVIASALEEKGYTELTPVQSQVLVPEAEGRDLLVSAQTGSGKTVAFGLAFSSDLLGPDGRVPRDGKPLALVIAPTRELALQVSRELAWLYRNAGAHIATCVGGMDPSKERRNLAGGAQIVVGTPGRLRDHLERGALDLSALRAVVLDEADEMLDMGFREELEEILDATPEGRRSLLFSATLPRTIVNLATRYQRNALRISTVGETRGHGDIAYQAITVAPPEVENAVVNLLRFHEAETAILFCATREKVRHLTAILQERGFAVVALSGEHTQSERNQAMQALRDRRARVCVATDVAARGIDLPGVSLVIHVEIPRDAEALQHRSGRTGRAGKKGIAALLVPWPRRRRVESMLRGAKIEAEWIDPPSAQMIRQQDHARLLEKLLAPVEIEEDDRALARELLDRRSPDELAAMLVQAHRARQPQPEELTANTPEARENARAQRHRPGFEDTVWFKLDVGRSNGADPKWILPVVCRRGHISKNEIGAIRIGPQETFVEIPRAVADKFADAARRTGETEREAGEESIGIELSDHAPRDMARQNRRMGRGDRDGGSAPVKPRPFRSGGFKPGKGGGPGKAQGAKPGKRFGKPGGKPGKPFNKKPRD
ncbi:DEAD/DEAH box helicase [Aurantiacibacter flavus]|uniref:DEAD/DEAH box helicase n=1 Tax=Aurantiacibacter flavus TaxID=3145232 RepID=A0ABV0CXW0_9SPHN